MKLQPIYIDSEHEAEMLLRLGFSVCWDCGSGVLIDVLTIDWLEGVLPYRAYAAHRAPPTGERGVLNAGQYWRRTVVEPL